MISPRKLVKMARKWQRLAALNGKRISFPRSDWDANTSIENKSPVAEKGHFVVYTADQRRFMFPMSYLGNEIIRQLLAMSEEEFGLPGNGPITLPCDAAFMEYVVSLIKRRVDGEIEKALLVSVVSTSRCSIPYSSKQGQNSQMIVASRC